jgi:hypothetical protein
MQQWDEKGIGIQIKYTDSLQVGKGNDQIVSSLKNPGLFAPADGGDPVSKEGSTNVSKAKPQVPKGVDDKELAKDASTVCKGLAVIIVFMIGIQLLVNGNFRDFWVFFFALQFICYSSFYDVVLPANAEIYITEFTNLIDLAFLNPDGLIRSLFNPKFNEQPQTINSDAQISVWNDVKVYLVLMVVLAVAIVLLFIASLVKVIRSDMIEGLSFIKSKFVWDYSI